MLSQHLCIHSRVSANLIRDFDTAWHLDGALNLSPYDDEKDRVEIFHCRENSSVHSQTLALVFRKQKISARDVLFEFHLKFWNTASIGIPARSLL